MLLLDTQEKIVQGFAPACCSSGAALCSALLLKFKWQAQRVPQIKVWQQALGLGVVDACEHCLPVGCRVGLIDIGQRCSVGSNAGAYGWMQRGCMYLYGRDGACNRVVETCPTCGSSAMAVIANPRCNWGALCNIADKRLVCIACLVWHGARVGSAEACSHGVAAVCMLMRSNLRSKDINVQAMFQWMVPYPAPCT